MECERKNKWFRPCKFEARFDTVFPAGLTNAWGSPSIIEALKIRKYVADVCVTCGKKIIRGENASA